MKYPVRFSPLAKEDKKDIKAYLSKFYPGTPLRFTALLKEHITKLKNNPYIYPEYPENTNYRRMFVSNYVVFYKVNDMEKQIDIYRILRASWDLPAFIAIIEVQTLNLPLFTGICRHRDVRDNKRYLLRDVCPINVTRVVSATAKLPHHYRNMPSPGAQRGSGSLWPRRTSPPKGGLLLLRSMRFSCAGTCKTC